MDDSEGFVRIPLDCDLAVSQVRDYAIFMADAHGRTASWNEGVQQVIGWPEQEWVGQPAHVLFPPDEREDAYRELETAKREGRANNDRWLVRNDGRRFYAHGATTAIFRDGRHVGFLKVLRDRTREHEYEEALRIADRRKNNFLAMLAHELRNPLGPIRSGLHIMQEARHNAAVLEQVREMMARQLGYLIHLIDDLMDVSRITHGKLELRPGPVLLSAIIESAVEMARGMIEVQGHSLEVNLPPRPVRFEGDLTRLTQVFANLLINAAKYTERGGRIVLNATADEDWVVVDVVDNGIGLSAEALEDVFEMFSQFAQKPDAPVGLGIGLALARSLVQMHGGSIKASSDGRGRGATFTVCLPRR